MDRIDRGSTLYIDIELGFDASLLDTFFLTFVQLEEVVIEKPIAAAIRGDESIGFDLTQADTLSLFASTSVKFQGRGSAGGREVHTEIIEMDVGDVLKEGVV